MKNLHYLAQYADQKPMTAFIFYDIVNEMNKKDKFILLSIFCSIEEIELYHKNFIKSFITLIREQLKTPHQDQN